MPHISLEYSANMEDELPLDALCDAVLEAALGNGVFEVGAVRVRAIRCDHYAIADRDPRNGFVDGSLRLGGRRDLATKRRVGEAIVEAMSTCLAPWLEGEHFALSFEVRDIDPDLSFKKNAMHKRLRT